MKSASIFVLLLLVPQLLWANTVVPKYTPECIAMAIGKEMKITLNEEIPLPDMNYSSQTNLVDFQNAVEAQVGFRPDMFLNIYVPTENDIYVVDEAAMYKNGRTIDDVIAHELVHFFQVKYEGSLVPSDYEEEEATFLQTWFRQKFMEQGANPCAY